MGSQRGGVSRGLVGAIRRQIFPPVGWHRVAGSAPEQWAVGTDLCRCDPSGCLLALAFRPGTSVIGHRDGSYTRWQSLFSLEPNMHRRAHWIAGHQTGADPYCSDHGVQGRTGWGRGSWRLRRVDGARCRSSQKFSRILPQPALLSTAPLEWCRGSGCPGIDRDVLRQWAADVRTTDRPLQHQMRADQGRARGLPP